MGWDGTGWDRMGWDGIRWDEMGLKSMGWDGMGWEIWCFSGSARSFPRRPRGGSPGAPGGLQGPAKTPLSTPGLPSVPPALPRGATLDVLRPPRGSRRGPRASTDDPELLSEVPTLQKKCVFSKSTKLPDIPSLGPLVWGSQGLPTAHPALSMLCSSMREKLTTYMRPVHRLV